MPGLVKDVGATGAIPTCLGSTVGGDGAEVAAICSALVATSDSSAASCSDGGAAGTF